MNRNGKGSQNRKKTKNRNITRTVFLTLCILVAFGMPVYNIVTSADEGGRTLENNTSALINDGNMYVFELMHFKEFPYAYNDYLAIMDSIEFEE